MSVCLQAEKVVSAFHITVIVGGGDKTLSSFCRQASRLRQNSSQPKRLISVRFAGLRRSRQIRPVCTALRVKIAGTAIDKSCTCFFIRFCGNQHTSLAKLLAKTLNSHCCKVSCSKVLLKVKKATSQSISPA